MNLPAWILSLIAERLWPLQPQDPALAATPEKSVGGAAVLGSGLSNANPAWRLADQLVELLSPRRGTDMSWGAWAVTLILPALVVFLLQEQLSKIGWLMALLHAAVLYFTVPFGRFYRRLTRAGQLAEAGEREALQAMTDAWFVDDLVEDGVAAQPLSTVVVSGAASRSVDAAAPVDHAGSATPTAASAAAASASASVNGSSATSVAGNAASQSTGIGARVPFARLIIDSYRDVFAPLFWYLLLGVMGPVAYAAARVAAQRCGGAARQGYFWVDWAPLRLFAASFASGGRLEDAITGLRTAHAVSGGTEAHAISKRNPGFEQELILLPSASGALGMQVATTDVASVLHDANREYVAPGGTPEPGRFDDLRRMFERVAMLWGGLWLLLWLIT